METVNWYHRRREDEGMRYSNAIIYPYQINLKEIFCEEYGSFWTLRLMVQRLIVEGYYTYVFKV